MKNDAEEIAAMYAASISLGVGQFCTNPGILIAVDNDDLVSFRHALVAALVKVPPAKMLHEGIAANYQEKKAEVLTGDDVQVIYEQLPTGASDILSVSPALTSTSAVAFINNPTLQQEVFGPYSIIVRCADMKEMQDVAEHLEGQLTASVMATENEILQQQELLECIKNLCGRLILNGVPTGVEVCLAMQHGGPFPSTTDSRFTSVGGDGIKRFARPLCYQDWPDSLLPDELKNGNPLKIWRTVNDEPTPDPIPTY
jgi:NADP-dependent aldehyde dehydrogenase